MEIQIREVKSRNDLKAFINLPYKIHKHHHNWIPPLYKDEWKFFDPDKNSCFRPCNQIRLLATKDNKVVGRIMGLIHHQHNSEHHLKNARFGYLECYNDKETAHALIGAIEDWAKKNGMTQLIGPYGFSDRDVQGLLIEGFEYEPVIDSACNFEYMVDLIESKGYTKDVDCVIYRYPLSNELPEIYNRMLERVTSRKEFQFLEFSERKAMKPFIVPVLRLVNESFTEIYNFFPLDEKEMYSMADQYFPILDPRFVKIITREGEVVAFILSLPNFYKGFKKAKGRLFPFGIIHILKALKTSKSLNTMLGAVKPSYQNQGLDIFLAMKTIESAKKAGMENLDTHVVLEHNDKMMNELERYGAHLIKKFRVYKKNL
jgi:hypothetical protein